MQREESGAGEEGERDQEDAGVSPAARRLAHEEAEQEAQDGRDEHEPEVSRLVLPDEVEAGYAQEEEEAGERDGQQEERAGEASHSAARSSASCSGPRKSLRW